MKKTLICLGLLFIGCSPRIIYVECKPHNYILIGERTPWLNPVYEHPTWQNGDRVWIHTDLDSANTKNLSDTSRIIIEN